MTDAGTKPRLMCQLIGPNGENEGTYRGIGTHVPPHVLMRGDGKIYVRDFGNRLLRTAEGVSILASLITMSRNHS